MALFLPFPFKGGTKKMEFHPWHCFFPFPLKVRPKNGVPSMALFLPFPFKGATKKMEFHPWHFFFPFPLKVGPKKRSSIHGTFSSLSL